MSPADRGNVVGIKPIVGLVSRDLVRLSRRLGTPGILSRTGKDGAAMLSGMAGRCSNDEDTSLIPYAKIPDYAAACKIGGLRVARIGIPRNGRTGYGELQPAVCVELGKAISVLKEMGAIVVDPADYPAWHEAVTDPTPAKVRSSDFKLWVEYYLSQLVENPDNIIAFTKANPQEEYPSRDIRTLVAAAEDSVDRNAA